MSTPAPAEPRHTAIGFIGTGAMGAPMVACLRRAGYAVTVCDADAARAARVAADTGATAVAHPAEAARMADVLVTMLPSSAIVEAVLLGRAGGTDGPAEPGALAGLRPGSVVVEMSSGQPARTRALAPAVQAAGGVLVDAPVSGGVPRALKGDLAIMFGGEAEVLARVQPVLLAMGSSVTRIGGLGTAHAMKALNNLVSAGGFLIGIEALLIGQRFGLDAAVMVDVLNASTGMNNSTQKKFKQFVLSRQFNSGFGLDLMVKDLGIALGVADDTATTAPFARLCRALWADAASDLGPGLDHTDLARFCEQVTGGEVLRPGPAVPDA